MKTKELIKLLQDIDPSGELECCVDNKDILDINKEPAYWDGCLQILKKSKRQDCYNVIGAIYENRGMKIVIHPWSIYDAIMENSELPIDIRNCLEMKSLGINEIVDQWRKESRELEDRLKNIKNK